MLIDKMRKFFKMSGTVVRYHRDIGERALDFALSAGREALKKARVKAEDVDLLIYAGVGRGWMEPATANLFQGELGLKTATCFDVMDACASWIRSLFIAKSFLTQKIYKLVMILNCEFNFKEYANFEFKNTKELENSFSAFTIGEAATATLLTSDDMADDSCFSFKTWGEKHGLCKIPLPNEEDFSPRDSTNDLKPMSFFTIPGELITFTLKKLAAHFSEVEAIASRVHDLVVTHAVSVPSHSMVLKLFNLDQKRAFETHSRFGNTVSASLPLALAVAEEEGRLQRGDRVMLVMGSAGVSTALGSFTY
ncbi:MAG: 3-oxoacyl-[acyl-carrier-protein] synthase III C-terminal domain-containing protein [Candidatus Binatia bacterium]|nr:3-oxoacyl-[acyl-carrier-protein] synthase III C-terminal domain-containing protein [Candidatus Binatia bacterium]